MSYDRKQYYKNFFTTLSGNALSTILPVAFTPVISRLYLPDDYGTYSIFISVVSVLSVFFAARYEQAIIIPGSEVEGKNLFWLSLIVASGAFVLFQLVSVVCEFSSERTDLLGSIRFVVLIPIAAYLLTINQIFLFWINRQEKFKLIASNRVLNSLILTAMMVGLGLVSSSSGGLVLSYLFTLVLVNVFLIRHIEFRWSEVSFSGLKSVAVVYKAFPKYYVLSGVLENLALFMPIFLFPMFYSNYEVGNFSMAQRIISLPLGVFVAALVPVFRQKAAELFNKQANCEDFFLENLRRVAKIVILPFLILFFASEYAFEVVLGEEWRLAGSYAKFLGFMFAFRFITVPLSSILIIRQKQKLDLLLQLFLFLSVFCSLYFTKHFFNDSLISVVAFSLTYVIKYIVELSLSYKYSKG